MNNISDIQKMNIIIAIMSILIMLSLFVLIFKNNNTSVSTPPSCSTCASPNNNPSLSKPNTYTPAPKPPVPIQPVPIPPIPKPPTPTPPIPTPPIPTPPKPYTPTSTPNIPIFLSPAQTRKSCSDNNTSWYGPLQDISSDSTCICDPNEKKLSKILNGVTYYKCQLDNQTTM